MTNRTVRMTGCGFGMTTATITALLDGQEIFSGSIPTLDQPLPALPDDELPNKILFTFEIPMSQYGTFPMSVTVEHSTVFFSQITANYSKRMLSNTTSGPDIYLDICNMTNGVRDPRSNVSIDGVPQIIQRRSLVGAWIWQVHPGSTLSYDLTIAPPVTGL